MLFNFGSIKLISACSLILGLSINVAASVVPESNDPKYLFANHGFVLTTPIVTPGAGLYALGEYTSEQGVPPVRAAIICGRNTNSYAPFEVVNHVATFANSKMFTKLKNSFPTILHSFPHDLQQCYIVEHKCERNLWLYSYEFKKLSTNKRRAIFAQIIYVLNFMKKKDLVLHEARAAGMNKQLFLFLREFYPMDSDEIDKKLRKKYNYLKVMFTGSNGNRNVQ
ncbi:hypothetical protein BDF22DRAFT_684071 [Syncephalis plumigaleata]|nr:hypothetical protein BDF22DRAFT_684071 [Syncephalis plumigaleata]